MSLKYKVLWVDDNKDEFSKEEKALNSFIEELFFEPKIDFCEDIASAKKFIDIEKYDVIFSDYNIDEEKGDDFISFIRGKSVNTEVLFYSGQNQLPEGRLDRVTFFFETGSHREERLLKKMKELISLTVAKLNDLTQLRGLVMSEVSELDIRMENLITLYFVIENEEEAKSRRKYFEDKIIKNVEDSTKQKLERVDCAKKSCKHKWRTKTMPEIISSIEFESSKKALTVDLIMEKLSYSFPQENFYDTYLNEIINNRNDLAHSYSEVEDGVEILITKKHGNIKFTEIDISIIRKNIRKYSVVFNELEQLINIKNSEIVENT